MTIHPESIKAGKCYLTTRGYVRRIVRFMPDGRVQFERRAKSPKSPSWIWVPGISDDRAFAALLDREVPCDWTPGDPEPGAD